MAINQQSKMVATSQGIWNKLHIQALNQKLIVFNQAYQAT